LIIMERELLLAMDHSLNITSAEWISWTAEARQVMESRGWEDEDEMDMRDGLKMRRGLGEWWRTELEGAGSWGADIV
ncbi:hypothetical protein HDU93_001058, partial [Gonapodya sp. JEL0774]